MVERILATAVALLAVSPSVSRAQRTPFEQGMVDWARVHTYVPVEGRGSTSGYYLVWDVTGAEDARLEVIDINGAFHLDKARDALKISKTYTVNKAAQGDSDVAHAVAKALFEVRLDWLRHATDKSDDSQRYHVLLEALERMEPYGLPLRLNSAQLLLDASIAFKGYATDMHLAQQQKWLALTPEDREIAIRVSLLSERQAVLYNQEWELRRDPARFEREFGPEFRSVKEELSNYSQWEQLLAPQTAYGLVPALSELQSLIGDDTLAIDIVVAGAPTGEAFSAAPGGEKFYVGTAFDSKGVYGPFTLGRVTPIDDFIQAIREEMESEEPALPELMEAARQLREVIIDPFLQHAAGKKRLFISLDGDLRFAPVPMLPDANDRFLIEDFEISFFDTFRQLVNSSARRSLNPAGSALLLGDPVFLSSGLEAQLGDAAQNRILPPLAGTRQEIDQVASILAERGQPGTALLGSEATEQAFYEKLKTPVQIIHFATHGCFFDPTETVRDPLQLAALTLGSAEDTLRTRGLIATTDENDGLVQASEILKLNLHDSQLVILSACDTAKGTSLAGDLVMGFRGAFFIAGAPNIILTLIPVSDAICPVLMSNFYRQLPLSEDESDAWTRSVRALLKDPAMSDRGMALNLLGPFIFVSHRPGAATDWPVGPIRGFLNWRRPLPTHKYVQALKSDPEPGLYLTADFRQRLQAVDSPYFGLVPANARVLQVDREGDEAFIKVNALDKSLVFVTIKIDGRWMVDDIIETMPDGL